MMLRYASSLRVVATRGVFGPLLLRNVRRETATVALARTHSVPFGRAVRVSQLAQQHRFLVNRMARRRLANAAEETSSSKKVAETAVGEAATSTEVATPRKKSILVRIREGVRHFVDSMRLLGADVATATRLLRRVTQGHPLTRRERRLLQRTAADVFRLVPVLIFFIVPFLEFALPLALKLFPNMLPSQFQDDLKREEDVKRQLKLRIELAKFLQDTTEEMAHTIKKKKEGNKDLADQFTDFMTRVRSGELVTNEEIVQFASLFKDDLTLDNMSRPQLMSMCKYMGMPSFGTDAFLRFQLRKKLAKLKMDDLVIASEGGLFKLTATELRQACRERGMRSYGLTKEGYMQLLRQWVDLSTRQNIPTSLLIFSRAFLITADADKTEEKLRATISALDDQIVEGVKLESATSSDRSEEVRQKLEMLKRENEIIEAERREAEAEQEKEKARQESEALVEAASEPSSAQSDAGTPAASGSSKPTGYESTETVPKTAPSSTTSAESAISSGELNEREEAALKKVADAVSTLAGVSIEKEELATLKEDVEDLKGELETLRGVVATGDDGNVEKQDTSEMRESEKLNKATATLGKKVTRMMEKLEKQVLEVDTKIGGVLKVIDKDFDGIVSVHELNTCVELLKDKPTADMLQKMIERIDADRDGKVTIEEMRNAFKAEEDWDREWDDAVEAFEKALEEQKKAEAAKQQENQEAAEQKAETASPNAQR